MNMNAPQKSSQVQAHSTVGGAVFTVGGAALTIGGATQNCYGPHGAKM